MAQTSHASEPIAIVGSSCRFPGDVTSPSQLWDLLCKPQDLSREVPSERFNAKAFYHKDGKHHGTTNSIKAYWLNANPAAFDAPFFQLKPQEAGALDPQQRLLLEVVYEAMEAAGFPLDQYSGKEVGVFSGCMTNDYETLSARDELATSEYFPLGNSRSILANRISHFFNFRGPSLTLDTACSSSLVALHLAMQSLREGHCTVACVTGSNVMLTADQFIVESALGLLSPAGKCHMWDTRADGYARGEGFAAIIVKPLSRAIADGDQIEAVIREIGINADGKTAQITEPNPEAQAALIRKTFERAGLDPHNPLHQCQYFEAHGTGTPVGDPREAAAIHNAFFTNANQRGEEDEASQSSSPAAGINQKLLVGSIKTVIGHTEATAGLAGILKVVWSLKHGIVPPNLHFENLNPSVKPFYTHLQIPTVMTPWPAPPPGQPRRGCVNSFGFGGANAHAIIEAYTPEVHGARAGAGVSVAGVSAAGVSGAVSATRPQSGPSPATAVLAAQPHRGPAGSSLATFRLPLVISAASAKSLRDVAQSYRTYLAKNEVSLLELAWHQYAHRSDLASRVTIPAGTRAEALAVLDSFLLADKSKISGNRHWRSISAKAPLRILGVFTGQGAQWPTMSKQLLQQNSVFRATIRNLDAVLKACPHPCSWTLEDQIMAEKEESRIDEAAVSQPLCTAVQIALVDFVRSIGVDFHTVVGHSSGEIAAAYAAGRLSAKDAIVVSYYRGLVAHLAGGPDGQKGGMMAVGMSEAEAETFCNNPSFGGRIRVAASNSPTSVTIAGDLDIIHQAHEQLTGDQKFVRLLRVDTAYHSPHMQKPAAQYSLYMQEYGVSPILQGNGIVWVSSVNGRPQTGATDLDCQYWTDNMVNQVQFRGAVAHALSESGDGFDCALEIGPHPALKGPFTETAKAHDSDSDIPYSCPLDRVKTSMDSVSDFLGFMWSRFGATTVDLRSYVEQSSVSDLVHSRLFNLPSYPFDHSVEYWRESRISREYQSRPEPPHELLGFRDREDSMHEMKWRNILKIDRIPWLAGHRFQDQALLPASAYCVMAVDAARYLLAGRPASLVELHDVDIFSGIAIDQDSPGVETVFSLRIVPADRQSSVIDATFDLSSCPANLGAHDTNVMKRNARGSMRIVLGQPSMSALPPRQAPKSETLAADPDAFYDMMKATGLEYKGPFRALTSVQRRFEYCCSTLSRVHPDETTTLAISPATLDACFQPAFLSFAAPGDGSLWTSFLPEKIHAIRFNLAAWEGDRVADPKDTLTVDTHIVSCTPPDNASKASVVVDTTIFNEAGEAEIQVEELVVRAWAHTNPKDDAELYLHTVVDVDPTDEIVSPGTTVPDGDDIALVEDCRRIISFYIGNHPDSGAEEKIDEMIRNSKHIDYLEAMKGASKRDKARLSELRPFIEEDARQVAIFRNHIGRIMQQIVHVHPWMNILHLTTTHTGLDQSILAAIGDACQSLTVGRSPMYQSSSQHGPPTQFVEGIREQDININEMLAPQMDAGISLDLVILPTALLGTSEATGALKNIREVMKPGGFLVLVDSHDYVLPSQSKAPLSDPTTPPHWQDPLAACGFTQQARNCNQTYPAGNVFVHQFLEPSTDTSSTTTGKLLLIRSAAEESDGQLVASLRSELSASCDEIICRSLDEFTAEDLESCTTAIVVANLEEDVMSSMTEHRMNQLRTLLSPSMTVLWATCDARSGNPEHAASFGFLRTIVAEVADLKVQVLDLEPADVEPRAKTIAAAFCSLAVSVNKGTGDNSLVKFEPEIYMDKGRRLISRVVPWKPGNDRVNAMRRVVKKPVSTLLHRVDLIGEKVSPASFSFELVDTEHSICEPPQGSVVIQVEYSSALPLKLIGDVSGYLCVGRTRNTGERIIALSNTNSSYITCPVRHTFAIRGDAIPNLTILHQVTRYTAALRGFYIAKHDKHLILIAPDVGFTKCLIDIAILDSPRSPQVTVIEVCHDESEPSPHAYLGMKEGGRQSLLRLHPRTLVRDLKRLLPQDGTIFNFLPEEHELVQGITAAVAPNRTIYPGLILCNSEAGRDKEARLAIYTWRYCVKKAMEPSLLTPSPIIATPLSELQSQNGPTPPFQLVNWKLDTGLTQHVRHTTEERLFSAEKTYFLFGLTRDFGHSLCRLFLERGARHIVLASRNPASPLPHWVTELSRAYGATIRIERADVTSLESLEALKKTVSPCTIGGVVNGAMVLEDRVFAEMSIATWHRVLAPKTIGSANLSTVFGSEPDIDFFIMTSSFAAVGGHAGQSNYAAANNYMNGLAAQRRRSGLPGSALNIGVIYGLGFLHRERGDLYRGLEREGYPPISERDLHHMFLEAIITGRPDSTLPGELTTGLRRYRRGAADPLHWQLDPRFGHFAHRARDEEEAEETKRSFGEELAGLEDVSAIADAIASALETRLRVLLGLAEDVVIDRRSSLVDLGLDSITVVNVRDWFVTHLGSGFALIKLLSAPSIGKLCLDTAEQFLKTRAGTDAVEPSSSSE